MRTSKLKNKRAYSFIEVKAINEEKREIVGIASTPSTDRMGDIVEPQGAVFKLPIPLLWQHDHSQPIGYVTEAKVTDKGIEFKAELVKVDQPSQLAARLEEAWQSILTGLVRGLSIGFRPIEYSYLDDNGVRFTKWEWFELSVVTIPANADCTIQTIKSLDEKCLAALGNKNTIQKAVNTPTVGAPTNKLKLNTVKLLSGDKNMNIQEQIKSFESKLEALKNEKTALVNKSVDEQRTLDVEEQEKYHEFIADIKGVEEHLAILREEEKSLIATAKPIIPSEVNKSSAIHVRDNSVIRVESKLEKGIEFARFVKCLAAAQGNRSEALEIAKSVYPEQVRIQNVLKAAVSAGTTTDPTWAGALVDYQNFAGDFVEFLRPQTIIGRFGTGNIPSLFQVPFNVKIPGQTSGGSAYWVGQGAPKPLTKFDFANVTLGFAKVANIAVLTDELVRFSNPSAETLVRNALAAAIIERIDVDFIDPAKAAVASISPASITNGSTAITSSGDPETDIEALFGAFIAANLSPANGVWIMSSMTALALSRRKNALSQREYPELTLTGGTLAGLPVIVSQYAGNLLILANASDIYLADDGQVVVDASREASLQMADDPTNNSATSTGTQLVSMFQTNSIAIRAERFINWQKRRNEAVAYVSGVNYGANQTT